MCIITSANGEILLPPSENGFFLCVLFCKEGRFGVRQDNREKLRRDTRMRTDAARGVYARRGNLPVLGGKIWLILYCLRRSFVQMTVCRYGAYCRRWKVVRSSIKSGGLPGYPESTYSGPGLRGLHLRDGRYANGRRTFFIRKWEPYRLLRERELYVAAEKVKNTFMRGTCQGNLFF